MRKLNFALFLCLLSLSCFATSFDSSDGSFSISLPPKWQKLKTTKGEVLNLGNGPSIINITQIDDCSNLSCLTNTANSEIKQLKKRKIKLVKNTYSGEEIKKGEFTTLDPYLYFSYTTSNINYTEGYFVADSKGYKIKFSGLSYADADLYMSFIAPKPKDAQDLPLITEEEPLIEENISAPEVQKEEVNSLSQTLPKKETPRKEFPLKFNMSRNTSIIICAILFYILVASSCFVYNFVFSSALYKIPTNPKSFYPIMGTRLYGSPDLFFRLYDSQGQNFIITSQRWNSFLKEYGFYGAIFFTLAHFIIESLTGQNIISSLWFNTSLSLCYLFAIFGLIFMLGGYLFGMIFPAPILVYTDKGKILFKIVRKSSGLFKFSYLVLTDAYSFDYHLETQKLFFMRKWTIFDKNNEIAVVREKSFLKALARKLFGHLGGSLRTNYIVEGKNESKGQIISIRRVTTNFRIDIDKPQAFPHMAMLAAAAVIFTKNRDKFYPWFD